MYIGVLDAPQYKVPDYVNPLTTALQSGMSMLNEGQNAYKNFLANKISQAQANNAQTMSDLDVQKAQYANQIMAPQAQLAPQFAQQDLLKQQYNNQILAPQATNATAITAADLYKQQLANKMSAANVPYADRLALAATKEAEAKPGLTQAQANYYNQGGGRAGVDQQQINTLQRQLISDGIDPAKSNEAASVYINGGRTLADGTPLPEPSGLASKIMDSINKHTNTAQAINQQRYANTLETAFQHADTYAPDAFKFAGIAGKLKGGVDAAAAQVGVNNPEYLNYRTFVDQIVPTLSTEILRTGGANSTDKQKAISLMQALPANITTNPALAEQEYNELKSLYRDIGKTISKGSAQIRNENTTQPLSNQVANGINTAINKGQSTQNSSSNNVQWIRKDGKLVRVG